MQAVRHILKTYVLKGYHFINWIPLAATSSSVSLLFSFHHLSSSLFIYACRSSHIGRVNTAGEAGGSGHCYQDKANQKRRMAMTQSFDNHNVYLRLILTSEKSTENDSYSRLVLLFLCGWIPCNEK